MIPEPVSERGRGFNRQFRAILKGTVWENYS